MSFLILIGRKHVNNEIIEKWMLHFIENEARSCSMDFERITPGMYLTRCE